MPLSSNVNVQSSVVSISINVDNYRVWGERSWQSSSPDLGSKAVTLGSVALRLEPALLTVFVSFVTSVPEFFMQH